MARELTLRIIIEQSPPGVDFALQKGSGKLYETVQKQRSDGKDTVFEFQPALRNGHSDIAALAGPIRAGAAVTTLRLLRHRNLRWSRGLALES